MNTKETVLEFIKENLSEIRHTEDHRNNITSVILILVGAILALISNNELGLNKLPLTIFIIVLGLFGIIVTRKLYERQKWYMGRTNLLYDKIDKLDTDLQIIELYNYYAEQHKDDFKVYSKIRMNVLWTLIHFFVVVIGVVLTVISIMNK